MGIHIHIICLVFVVKAVLPQSDDGNIRFPGDEIECFTPNDANGFCVNIMGCPELRTLLETQRKNSTTVSFLRKSLCGFEGRDPKVCCPSANSPSSTSDDAQTVETTTTRLGGSRRPNRPNKEPSFGNNNNNNNNDNDKDDYYETISSKKLPSQNTCGRTNTSHIRIVGGNPADLGAWPWMAALGYRDAYRPSREVQWLCGGALISDRYVLTAAHCIFEAGSRKVVVVRLGDLNLDNKVNDGAEPVDIPISRIITHEQYNQRDITNDIALLKMEKRASFNLFIQPICLPIKPKHRNNMLVSSVPFVAGWGSTSFHGPATTSLMELQVPVLDNNECKKLFSRHKTVIDDRSLCAGYLTGGKDSCQGDSGGPLMWPNGNQFYLVGVVSFGIKCAEPGYPGVYTRVTSFVDWIVDTMNKN